MLADTHATGQALANFFAGTTDTVSLTGSVRGARSKPSAAASPSLAAPASSPQPGTHHHRRQQRQPAADRQLRQPGLRDERQRRRCCLIRGRRRSLRHRRRTDRQRQLRLDVRSGHQFHGFGDFLKPSTSTAAPAPSRFPPAPYVFRLTADNTTLTTGVSNVSPELHTRNHLPGSGSTREVLVGATRGLGFLGDDGGTAGDTTDDTGVRLTELALLAVVGGLRISRPEHLRHTQPAGPAPAQPCRHRIP
ncbi:MAG UNVERIFIED_CONTAM: hypothetical protein LVR18_48580 [Planctomycetaceae bacterium]